MTIGGLRKYLNEIEDEWTEEYVMRFGEFEDQDIVVDYFEKVDQNHFKFKGIRNKVELVPMWQLGLMIQQEEGLFKD